MKHLLTAIACCLAVACFGQGTTIYEYPWNPDWNNDNFVGSSDLTGFLSAFGSEFGNPPEPCDYDGTPLEDLFFGAINGELIIDSVFIAFEAMDTQTYYVPGCPESITDTLIFINNAMLDTNDPLCNSSEAVWGMKGIDAYGFWFSFQLQFNYSNGEMAFLLHQPYIYELGDGFFSGGGACVTGTWSVLPWPSDWYLDDEGIHIETAFNYGWPSQTNYLTILPYWHYAE